MIKQGKIVDQTSTEKRNFYYFIIFVLVIVTGFSVKFWLDLKKQNESYRLQVLLLRKEKKQPKPWARLLAPKPVNPSTIAKSDIIEQPVSTKAAAPIREESPLANQSTEVLANSLNIRIQNIKMATPEEIEKTIGIADELISREPDSYSAYKAKLISLLTREGKFNLPVEESEINQILETLATFDLSVNPETINEANLVLNLNYGVSLLNERLNQIQSQKQTVEAQLEIPDLSEQTLKVLNDQLSNLNAREEETMNSLSTLPPALDNETIQQEKVINEDIVQIPFMRMLAKNNYEGVLENAETFIRDYPTSNIGYFYLVKALEHLGSSDEAIEILAQSPLSTDNQRSLWEKVNASKTEDPKLYWEKLKF